MQLYRIVVPLVIVSVLAVIALVFLYRQHIRDENLRRQERLVAQEKWTGVCQFDNPATGAKCLREEFHLENHYREVNGKLVFW